MKNVRGPLIWLAAIAAVAALVVVAIMAAAGLSIFSAHVRAGVAKRTLNPGVTIQVFNPNNKIQSQGYFESLAADVRGFIAKARIQKQLIASDPSAFNRTNLAGIEQECVDAVQQYNSAARSISSEAFRSADLPYQLDAAPCAA